jgi:DNA segregation ATPase FtsK/SpoIIIE, S-DNA-T family
MARNYYKTENSDSSIDRYLMQGLGLVLLFFALFLFISLLSFDNNDVGFSSSDGRLEDINNIFGSTGAYLSDLFLYFFGFISYIFVIFLLLLIWNIKKNDYSSNSFFSVENSISFLAALLLILSLCSLTDLHFAPLLHSLPIDTFAGGLVGSVLNDSLLPYFGLYALTILQIVTIVALISIIYRLSWFNIFDFIGKSIMSIVASEKTYDITADNNQEEPKEQNISSKTVIEKSFLTGVLSKVVSKEHSPKIVKNSFNKEKKYHSSSGEKIKIEPSFVEIPQTKKVFEQKQVQIEAFKDANEKHYPSLSLLSVPNIQKQGISKEALQALSDLLEIKLADFNIKAKVVAVHPGPIITRFELELPTGLKVATVSNLAKDIARSLAVISVRVVEVIVGKSTIGIEIPNESRQIVYLSEIIKSSVFDKASSLLTIALGKDISGNPIITDLGKMPHLLVAGTTGSGKSVAVNAMILSLLYKATAKEVRLILIDPKMLELSVYDGIGHLLTPVVTDMKEAANALRWCVAEMDRRYKYMASQKVRNITGFNKVIKDAKKQGRTIKDPFFKAVNPEDKPEDLEELPFIVVVVDEFADLMMVVGKKIEELIARIAQKARAAGIHLILATQRPSVDVVTGLIKANIPTRIAFQVSSKIDSRTILDQPGAEQLLGHGDMLFLPPGTSLPQRVHGAFVDDNEVNNVVADLKEHKGDIKQIDLGDELSVDDSKNSNSETDDELYDEAVKIVTTDRKGSISYLQRRLSVGYNRAADLIEAMEKAGVVSAAASNGSREVLAPPPT